MHRNKLTPARDCVSAGPLRSAIWLLFGLLTAFGGAGLANAACPTPNAAGQPDLTIDSFCTVSLAGTYNYSQINIVSGGSLFFNEPDAANTSVDFWASSIVVEANGVLQIGTPGTPYGSNGGFLTIHLYGNDRSGGQGPTKNSGQGVLCKSPGTDKYGNPLGPCGIPPSVWTDNGKSLIPGCGVNAGPWQSDQPPKKCIPGLATTVSDYFYQYGPLYGDERCTNGDVFDKGKCGGVLADGLVGYFGYKTLAVSYDGSLFIYGWKGADYDPTHNDPTNSGYSWLRLSGDLEPGTRSLILDSANGALGGKWFRKGEPIQSQFVVTTTDYLPTHSELFTIDDVSPDGLGVIFKPPGAAWRHVGWRNPLGYRLYGAADRLIDAGMDFGLLKLGPETRAAVALLTRSVRIVSAGDTIGQQFSDMPPTYSFGGHTIFRQGFRRVQLQGVEFDNLGQGGKLGHYPIHFHKTRLVPLLSTFVKDSSVNESNTRWYVLHDTQGVILSRNVGYKSIGHGYYLEDGTETDNGFYSNIGILARAAIDNVQNPRKVPGILADNADPADFDPPTPGFPYRSDNEYPAVFWITNGWNSFEGNMAAGAEACGAAYWFVPTVNSDSPDVPTADNVANGTHMKWDYDADGDFGYAGLQRSDAAVGTTFGGATPLLLFYKNYASSAMFSFQTTTDAPPCDGFIAANTNAAQNGPPTVREITSLAPPPVRTNDRKTDLINDPYYPHTIGLRQATQCPAATTILGRYKCNDVHVCTSGNEANCAVTVLDHYTSAFNWAPGNVSAVWLRPQWYLLDNSVLSDVQNGALTFVSGGDFTHAEQIQGYWSLALDTIFIGHSQPQDSGHAFALASGPFNNLSGVKCDPLPPNQGAPNYCLNSDSGISMPVSGFFMNQRMMNIYDGPSYQDSSVYLDVNPTFCPLQGYGGDCMYGVPTTYVPKIPDPDGRCYLPNAAIAWKQPNGFFYPPAFHSTNLYFDNVDIRHYVIDPLFKAPKGVTGHFDFGQGGTYITDQDAAARVYCLPALPPNAPNLFDGFTAIDRQTELNDDDGTLTGLSTHVQNQPASKQTISVNDDNFFTAPVETPQCLSNIGGNSVPANACKPPDATQAPVTAKTSPYDYVTTVVWHPTNPGIWDSDCSNPQCYGVPLYRQFLAGNDGTNGGPVTREWALWSRNQCGPNQTPNTPACRWPFIRMAAGNTSTRLTLTVNHGSYYLDTTVPLSIQSSENFNQQGSATRFNVFEPGETYTVFFLYAKPSTRQSYQIYVGTDPKIGSVTLVRVKIPDGNFAPNKVSVPVDCSHPMDWLKVDCTQLAETGIITVSVDFTNVKDLDPATDAGLCQPHSFCTSSSGSCVSTLGPGNPLKPHYDRVCGWAVKDLDCPTDGCYGFQFTLPAADIFKANATPDNPSPNRPQPTPFPDPDWGAQLVNTTVQPDSEAAPPKDYGPSCYYSTLPTKACLDSQ